jgi:cell division protein ZapA
MDGEVRPITVRIMEKEYLVACTDEERAALMEAAKLLDRRMREARDSGKVMGSERIAVITALNIAHELLQVRGSHAGLTESVNAAVRRMHNKLDLIGEDDNPAQRG